MTKLRPEEDGDLFPAFASLHSLQLLSHEQLLIHMDCMNALGEVITADEVEELGGACWIYIRVSVHGTQVTADGSLGAIAVGDTFLFSPYAVSTALSPAPAAAGSLLLSDGHCVTHSLPYVYSFLSAGVEERFARYVSQLCQRNIANSSATGREAAGGAS